MLPGPIRILIVFAAALATVFAGVWGAFAEVHWPGTSISSTECRAHDFGCEDESGRLAEETESEDQDDEDDRELLPAIESIPLRRGDVAVSFLRRQERHLPGSRASVATYVRGPPAAL